MDSQQQLSQLIEQIYDYTTIIQQILQKNRS